MKKVYVFDVLEIKEIIDWLKNIQNFLNSNSEIKIQAASLGIDNVIKLLKIEHDLDVE